MIKLGIITVSDRSSRGERKDLSGPEIRKWAHEKGFQVITERIVPDDIEKIKLALTEFSNMGLHLIFTTGGTGFAPRDVTPEATLAVIEKHAPGFAEVMRSRSLEITPRAMLSRAVAGIRKRSLIINLPGSPKAVRENLGFIQDSLDHAIDLLCEGVSDCGSV